MLCLSNAYNGCILIVKLRIDNCFSDKNIITRVGIRVFLLVRNTTFESFFFLFSKQSILFYIRDI